MTSAHYDYDVVIIGAGPSGAVAAALLVQKGYKVCVVERQTFPRFSIGESLLPQCMVFIEEAGLLDAVKAMGFQYKDGAAFNYQNQTTTFEFSEKSTPGPHITFQVIRAEFDQALIEAAQAKGAVVRFNTKVNAIDFSDGLVHIVAEDEAQNTSTITARFCLDASGYGRVLPRLLNLDRPSGFPSRSAFFTHVTDHIDHPRFSRDRILITVHPDIKDIWYWLIPFSNGTSSIGIVGEDSHFQALHDAGSSSEDILKHFIQEDTLLNEILAKAEYNRQPVQIMRGYSSSVTSLHGQGYALLGNAGEFLDPVFSSGITIAMKSASLAAGVLDRHLRGEDVNWDKEFSEPLMTGVQTFRAFVESWYEGKLIDIFFTKTDQNDVICQYLISILAGYAWDHNNPFVANPKRRLNMLHEVCQ